MEERKEAKEGVVVIKFVRLLTGLDVRGKVVMGQDNALWPPRCSGCVKVQSRIAILGRNPAGRHRCETGVIRHQDDAPVTKQRFEGCEGLREKLG